MVRIRGFPLKHRVIILFGRVCRQRRAYRRLNTTRVEPFSKLFSFSRKLKLKAQAIFTRRLGPGRGYSRVGQEPICVPKGQLAVYMGQKDGKFERILVPVVYFRNPLFLDLLKESEKEYGFNHPGCITIPCPVSEFELVQTRIKAGRDTRKFSWRIGSK